MPGYKSIGEEYNNSWGVYEINNKEFPVLEPREFFLDVLRYDKENLPNNQLPEWDLKTFMLIGGQGTGKTNIIRYLVALIRSIGDYRGRTAVVETNDIRILSDKRYDEYFEGKKVIILIVDDAIESGTDSRRAMSGANVDTSRQFCITRHTLEERFSKNGIIFMFFASQIYSRLDPTIRSTCQVKIFTQYYPEKWFKRMFNPEEAELLRIATKEGNVKNNFHARRFALGKTISDDVFTMEVPFSTKDQVPYPTVDRTIDKKTIINTMAQALLEDLPTQYGIKPEEFDLDDWKRSQLKGYLRNHVKEQVERNYTIEVSKSDIISAIDKAAYEWKDMKMRRQDKEVKKGSDPNTPPSKFDRVKFALHQEGVADLDTISKRTGLPNADISKALYNHSDEVINLRKGKGVYCLKGYEYSQSEIEKYVKTKTEKKKRLVMS
jgi:hypothetical protein